MKNSNNYRNDIVSLRHPLKNKNYGKEEPY